MRFGTPSEGPRPPEAEAVNLMRLAEKGLGAYAPCMSAPVETVVLTLPRALVPALPSLSRSLNDRMHALLERNTEGTLAPIEREELETLVEMAQFAQLLAMAAEQGTGRG